MILDCKQLYNSTLNPKINTITLDLLREYYETYLNPYVYQYEIINESDKETNRMIIELRFNQENFCHLLGIESIFRYSVSSKELLQYRGQAGWDNIKVGLLDFKLLKDKNKLGFKNNKSRYVFFYLIPKLLERPKGVLYDSHKSAKSKVDCELLFFDEFEKAYIHIGIKKDEKLGYYVPKTFLIEKITDNCDGLKYIENQTHIIVKKLAVNLIESSR